METQKIKNSRRDERESEKVDLILRIYLRRKDIPKTEERVINRLLSIWEKEASN